MFSFLSIVGFLSKFKWTNLSTLVQIIVVAIIGFIVIGLIYLYTNFFYELGYDKAKSIGDKAIADLQQEYSNKYIEELNKLTEQLIEQTNRAHEAQNKYEEEVKNNAEIASTIKQEIIYLPSTDNKHDTNFIRLYNQALTSPGSD